MQNVNFTFRFTSLIAAALLCQQPLGATGAKVELIMRGEALRDLEVVTSIHVHINLE